MLSRVSFLISYKYFNRERVLKSRSKALDSSDNGQAPLVLTPLGKKLMRSEMGQLLLNGHLDNHGYFVMVADQDRSATGESVGTHFSSPAPDKGGKHTAEEARFLMSTIGFQSSVETNMLTIVAFEALYRELTFPQHRRFTKVW